MRRGEAIGLRWEDVDLDGAYLSVVQQITEVHGRGVVGTPKTKRGTRDIPVDRKTVAMLQRQQETQDLERSAWGPAWNDAGLVFTREDGRPLRPEYATRHFQALAERSGLPAIRLHDLRHTNASLALEAGVEMKVVSERLGHSQISVTADLYTHVSNTVGRAAAEKSQGRWRRLPKHFLQHPCSRGPKPGPDGLRWRGNEQGPRRRFRWSGAWSSVSTQSAPGGIRTPNLLIRNERGRIPLRISASRPVLPEHAVRSRCWCPVSVNARPP